MPAIVTTNPATQTQPPNPPHLASNALKYQDWNGDQAIKQSPESLSKQSPNKMIRFSRQYSFVLDPHLDGQHLKHTGAAYNCSSTNKRSCKSGWPYLPTSAKEHLKEWFWEHSTHPYPTYQEKQYLCRITRLSRRQVENWFMNHRRRHKSRNIE